MLTRLRKPLDERQSERYVSHKRAFVDSGTWLLT
jgi:hypothetical protein